MKIEELKKTKDLNVEWNITIPSAKVDSELKKKYLELLANVKIPGFRQGKVPMELVKKRYSKSVIPDVLDKLVNESLKEAVISKEIKPSVQPEVNIKNYAEGKDLVFNVNFQIMPNIPEIDFKKIDIERSNLKISAEDIENTLKDLSKKHERFLPLKNQRKSKMTDLILFDYIGKIDGKDFENNSGKDETVILGSKKYIPGYEEQMVGLGINESKEIEVVFPDDYREKKIAGKKAKFRLKIKDIQEKVQNIPIDDKLAEELGEKNLAMLKEKIEEKMKNDFKKLSMLKMRRQASEELLKRTNFDIPSKMIDQESDFLKNQSNDKKEKERKELATRRVKLGLLINSIAEKDNISVDDSDISNAVANEAAKYPGQENQVVEFYKNNPNMVSNLRGIALEEKVMNYVVNSCKKSDKDCTMEEIFKSDFLKQEKLAISDNKKEKKK